MCVWVWVWVFVCERGCRQINEMQFVTTVVHDGVEALELVSKLGIQDYSVVVTDLIMNRMGGIELITKLRQMQYCGPILAVSGTVTPEHTKQVMLAGGDDLLVRKTSCRVSLCICVSINLCVHYLWLWMICASQTKPISKRSLQVRALMCDAVKKQVR